MAGRHLSKRNGRPYYQRQHPEKFQDVDPCKLIVIALNTNNETEARALAAQHMLELKARWQAAQSHRVSL